MRQYDRPELNSVKKSVLPVEPMVVELLCCCTEALHVHQCMPTSAVGSTHAGNERCETAAQIELVQF